MRFAAPALLILSGATFASLAKPLLPVDTYVAYAAALGQKPGTGERKELARLPQFFADMHGWPEMVATVAEAYETCHRKIGGEPVSSAKIPRSLA